MALTQVKSDGIATGAVTATQIATGAVTANDLEDSGVTAGTYGSSSAIPAITVDAKGRVTSASTSSIDSTAITNGTSNVSVAANSDITFVNAGGEKARVDAQGFLFGDNDKARFGSSGDLAIYHNGTRSIIEENGTGNLQIRSNQTVITNQAANETQAVFNQDGQVQLFHDGSQKFNTLPGGINVTGSVTCDGLVSDGNIEVRSGFGSVYVKDSNSNGTAAQSQVAYQTSDNTVLGQIGYIDSSNSYLYVKNATSGAGIAFQTNSTNRCQINSNGHLVPFANNTYDLGDSTNRWRNVYTNDLNLSNEGGTNDVDGTWGNWTIQEGEDDLFLLNRRNGKKYKFNLTEVN